MIRILKIIVTIIALYVLGVVTPKAINEKFMENYGGEVWSQGLAIAEGVFLAAFLLCFEEDGLLFWIPFLGMIFSYAFGIWISYEKAKQYGAGIGQVALGILAQVLASASLAFVILFIVAMIVGANDNKKSRRRKRR